MANEVRRCPQCNRKADGAASPLPIVVALVCLGTAAAIVIAIAL